MHDEKNHEKIMIHGISKSGSTCFQLFEILKGNNFKNLNFIAIIDVIKLRNDFISFLDKISTNLTIYI